MSRGIADDAEDSEVEEIEEVSNADLSEMIFILFNEIKTLQVKVDEVLNGKG